MIYFSHKLQSVECIYSAFGTRRGFCTLDLCLIILQEMQAASKEDCLECEAKNAVIRVLKRRVIALQVRL